MSTLEKLYYRFALSALLLIACAPLKADIALHQKDNKDITFKVSGNVKHEFVHQAQPRLLNKSIPDRYNFWKTTLDLTNKFVWGEKTHGHAAVEGNVTLRHKANYGTAGKTSLTDTQSLKLGDALVGSISHDSAKPVVWVREMWLSATLNALLGLDLESLHKVKMGYFGFKLGRGISLGEEYGTPKGFLAVYNRVNDFFPAGVLISGASENKKLSYDLYIGMLDNKSASMKDTFNHTKSNHIGNEATPWSGSGNNNTVYAVQVGYEPVNNKDCRLKFAPYVMYNDARDQKIEVDADSKSGLGTIGVNFESRIDNVEFDVEVARNFGKQHVYNIDRNNVVIKQNNDQLSSYYTHIEEDVSSNWVAAKTYKELRAALATDRRLENGKTFTVNVGGENTNFRSALNRIRAAYQNSYEGFMAVCDAAYLFKKAGICVATTAGYVSGDGNPHATEADKKYRGFVGLNEYYVGRRVPSQFMFASRVTKRPLSLNEGGTYLEDPSFTDIVFTGMGATISPRFFLANKGFTLNFNLLGFFKEHASKAVTTDGSGTPTISTTEDARKYFGTELNLSSSLTPVEDMKVTLRLATFIPGTYYKDIKGAAFSDDMFNTLDQADTQGLDSAKYRIGNDTSYLANLVFEYLF